MKCSQTTLNYASQLHQHNYYESLIISLHKCTADVKDWILENKLKLNVGKTEAIRFLSYLTWPCSLTFIIHLSWRLQNSVHTESEGCWFLA